MGYAAPPPANQLGNAKNVWIMTDYGLPQLWVKTASTLNYYNQKIFLGPNTGTKDGMSILQEGNGVSSKAPQKLVKSQEENNGGRYGGVALGRLMIDYAGESESPEKSQDPETPCDRRGSQSAG
ncbi:hypothetical protein BJV74DRAFT_799062 [Russula compacta]|nr:hypothetical protein BJV74DRAFT_799062 [Russula compacta]